MYSQSSRTLTHTRTHAHEHTVTISPEIPVLDRPSDHTHIIQQWVNNSLFTSQTSYVSVFFCALFRCFFYLHLSRITLHTHDPYN